MAVSNQLLFGTQARQKLLKGINIVADAVGSTLGPRGQNVSIEKPGRNTPPHVVHDGVTVSNSINLKDPFENQGAQLLKQAADQTNQKAGDGTTTATILAQAISNEALKVVEAGANPMVIKKGIEDALGIVLKELDKLAKKITTKEEIEQVATIASADPFIGKLVAEALDKVGKDGVVTVDEGKGFETYIEYKQGIEIDRGYLSPYFVTNQETVEAIIEEPYILLTDKKINYSYQLLPFLEKFLKSGKKNLVIFAGEVVDEAMHMLVVNKLRGAINCVAIQAPAFGGRRIDELTDLAILTGGVPILEDSGRELQSVGIEELGQAGKITVDRDKAIMLEPKGKQKEIDKRITQIREQLKVVNTDYDRDIKQQRIANMLGKAAIIYVGANTEVELKEKKERVIDAKNATKAAIEDGIIAGGEITLHILARCGGILGKALQQPLIKLVENSGLDYTEIRGKLLIEEQLADGILYPMGIDVMDGEIKDLIKAGIIDPVKVTKSALVNAVSVAVMVITCACLIVDEREEK